MVPSMRRSIALLLLALVACELLAEAQAQLTHSAVNHPRPPVSHLCPSPSPARVTPAGVYHPIATAEFCLHTRPHSCLVLAPSA